MSNDDSDKITLTDRIENATLNLRSGYSILPPASLPALRRAAWNLVVAIDEAIERENSLARGIMWKDHKEHQ